MAEIFLVTLSGVVLGQLAPGPNLVAVAGAALGRGRAEALCVAAGVATVVLFWVTFAALGLASLIAIHPSVLIAMKLVGGGYLLYVAAKAIAAALRGGPVAFGASAPPSTAAAFRRGALINLTNPKSALMWAAVATFMFGAGLSAGEVLLFAPIGALSALLVYGAYALFLSSSRPRAVYARFARVFEGLFGAVFGALGGSLVIDGAREALR